VYYFTDQRTYIGQWKDNSMNGYGEFYWKDGKRYVGYYENDKKEGFGIYYWEHPHRAYIGFWKQGKQEGIGKYINTQKTRYGLWSQGEKRLWYETEKEALEALLPEQQKYMSIFKYDLKEITLFLNS
jgi:hypothetical protein